MTLAPARATALRALARVRRDAAFSGPVLAAELAASPLSRDDTALATRLVYGTLAGEGVLDEVLARWARGNLEPGVRDALRLAAFEILFSRVPAYAVVDQGVEAVRKVRPQASGLANAVLRRVAEAAPSFPWGDPDADRDALARATGHPRWIVDVFIESLGEESGRQSLWSGLDAAPTYVRLNPFAGDAAETLVDLERAGAAPSASPPDPLTFELAGAGPAFRSEGIMESRAVAMDAAAQVAPLACVPAPGMRLLDAAAGRGNKTLALQSIAVRSGGPASISATDVHPGKVAALVERLDRLRVPGVVPAVRDILDTEALIETEPYDAVLLDAPCTGLGTLRRYPEKRWRLSPGDLATLSELQFQLLRSCARVVRPGGGVVYSTCSIAEAETSAVVKRFLSEDSLGEEFELDCPDWSLAGEWARFVATDGCFRSWPTPGGPDGHYVAALRRRPGRRDVRT